ncbi:DUF305 domain-containing protein [Streptomyces sp. ODS28]|uniref:DUF305 domain-containing protein n=1 Tax=Streptomyces sp. ODS28 TaxID=3136688 RepID=UPI0031ED426B
MNAITFRKPARTARRRIAVAGAVAAGSLLLAACGGGDGTEKDGGHEGHGSGSAQEQSAKPSQGGESPAPGPFNDADVMFAQMMIPHHEQALEMSQAAPGKSSDKEVQKLAAQIEKAQGPEIRTMKSWLRSWGKPESAGHGMDHGMSGMMSDSDMKELKAAKGEDFDKKYTSMMIDHHKGAVEMAEEERAKGRNATAKKLAKDVIDSQSAEIEHLQKIHDRL